MASSSLLKKPVFAVTNFGTRIVIAVSLDCTVGHFKREFERAHFNCFPELGKISVYGLKVRRKSCFYCLSELFPLKYAFEGAKGWFLYITADHAQNQSASKKNGLQQGPLTSKGRVFGFASGADGNWDRREDLCTEKKCLSETISETISVSDIINRYFSSFDEVNSNSRLSLMELQTISKEQMKAEIASDSKSLQFGIPSPFVPKTPVQVHCQLQPEPNLRSSEDKPKTKVGIRLLEASKNLGLSASKKNLALSLSKFVDGGSVVTGSANTHIRRLIFEITDEDD